MHGNLVGVHDDEKKNDEDYPNCGWEVVFVQRKVIENSNRGQDNKIEERGENSSPNGLIFWLN